MEGAGGSSVEFPIKLSLKPLQGGAEEQNRVVEVDDPQMTVLALKELYFKKETAEGRKVRIIHMGKMLGDGLKLGECSFGKEAIVHVVISSPPDQQGGAAGGGGLSAGAKTDEAVSAGAGGPQKLSQWPLLLAHLLFFVITGAILQSGAQKTWPVGKLMSSQFLCISASLWLYLLLYYGLPAFGKALTGRPDSTAEPSGGSSSPLLR